MNILKILMLFVLMQIAIGEIKKLIAQRAELIARKEELSEFKSLYIGMLATLCYTLAFTYYNSIDKIVANFNGEINLILLNLLNFLFFAIFVFFHDCFIENNEDIDSFSENIIISMIQLTPPFIVLLIVF